MQPFVLEQHTSSCVFAFLGERMAAKGDHKLRTKPNRRKRRAPPEQGKGQRKFLSNTNSFQSATMAV
jgi:hypothetical protein